MVEIIGGGEDDETEEYKVKQEEVGIVLLHVEVISEEVKWSGEQVAQQWGG